MKFVLLGTCGLLFGLVALQSIRAEPVFPGTVQTTGLSSSQGTLRIGLVGSFSGSSAPIGESMRNGVRLAVSEINFVGGLLGKQIELVERDDQGEIEPGMRAAEELTGRDKVVAVIGVVNHKVALGTIDVYQKAHTPLMIAVAASPDVTRKFAPPAYAENYIFRIAPSLQLDARVQAEDLRRRQVSRVVLLGENTPYGESCVAAFREAAKLAGVEILLVERFRVGERDMAGIVKEARATKAQSLVLAGSGPELAAIASEAMQQGWNVPLIGTWTVSHRSFIERAGRSAEGALMPQTFILESATAAKNSFLLAYNSLFKTPIISSPMAAAQGYDGMYLLAAAIRQAASPDGGPVRDALENLKRKVNGVITTYDKPFSRGDHEAIKQGMLVMGRIHNGRVDYAYPDDGKRGQIATLKERK